MAVESIHIIIATEHDGSGDPAVLLVTHSEEFAHWVAGLLEKAGTSQKLLLSSFPVIDPNVSEGDLWQERRRRTGPATGQVQAETAERIRRDIDPKFGG